MKFAMELYGARYKNLSFHKSSGQWCKRIKGRVYYFGSNKAIAIERYFRELPRILSGRPRYSFLDTDKYAYAQNQDSFVLTATGMGGSHYSTDGKKTNRDLFEDFLEMKKECIAKEQFNDIRKICQLIVDGGTWHPQCQFPSEVKTYFIQSGDGGFIKIGQTKNVMARKKYLQTASPEALFVLAYIDGNHECYFHEKLRGSNVRGEWFFPSFNLLNEMFFVGLNPPVPIKSAQTKRVENGMASSSTWTAQRPESV